MKNRYYFFLFLSFPFFVAAQSETQSIDTLSLLDSENESRLQLLLDTENKKAKEILQYAAQRTNTEFGVKSLGDFSSDRFEVDHNYFFKYVVTNVRSSACLFYKANILQDWDLLLNPEYLAAPYDCNILDYDVSKDSHFLAFTYAKEGEQFLLAQAIMLGNRVMQKDLLFGVASPELTWFRNGFFYHRITSGVDGLETSIWYHELGKEQENDKKIFSGNKENNGKIGVIISRDEKRVIFYDLGKTENYFFKNDLNDEMFSPLKLRVKKQDDFRIVSLEDTVVYALVNAKDGQRAFVKWNISQPKQMELVIDVFPDAYLLQLARVDDYFIGIYLEKNVEYIRLFNFTGEFISEYALPPGLSVSKLMEQSVDDCVYFSLEGPTIPPVHWELNLKTKRIGNYGKTITDVDPNMFTAQSIAVPLSNGKEIWVDVYSLKDHDFNKPAKCIMELIQSDRLPAHRYFDPALLHYVKEGGVFCKVNFISTASAPLTDVEVANSFNEVMYFLVEAKVIVEGMVACIAENEGADGLARAIAESPQAYSAAVLINGNVNPSLFHNAKPTTDILFVHTYVRQKAQVNDLVKSLFKLRSDNGKKHQLLLKTDHDFLNNEPKSYQESYADIAEHLAFLMFYQAN